MVSQQPSTYELNPLGSRQPSVYENPLQNNLNEENSFDQIISYRTKPWPRDTRKKKRGIIDKIKKEVNQ